MLGRNDPAPSLGHVFHAAKIIAIANDQVLHPERYPGPGTGDLPCMMTWQDKKDRHPEYHLDKRSKVESKYKQERSNQLHGGLCITGQLREPDPLTD